MNAEQIFQAIQSLPLSERRGLFERLSGNLQELTTPREPPPTDEQGLDLVGFLADDPELADEIYKIATVEREGEDLRDWDHEARSSR
jgi:hypothetical protein